MHKSKLSGFIIDCCTEDLPAAAAFWSGALGMPVRELPGSEGETYSRLDDAQHGLHIEVQKVDHPSRVHLDIETDDIERRGAPPRDARRQKNSGGAQLVGDGSADRTAILRGTRRLAGFRAASSQMAMSGTRFAAISSCVARCHKSATYLT